MEKRFLQIPAGKEMLSIPIVCFGDKAIIEKKDDNENLKKFLVKWAVKHGKMSDNDYQSYVRDRQSYPSEEFGFDNNPYFKSIDSVKSSIFGGSRKVDDNIGLDMNYKPPVNIQPSAHVQAKTLMDASGKFKLYIGEVDAMGKKSGEGTEFYENNRPKFTGKFVNDMAHDQNGTFFHENGKIMYTGSVQHGALAGNGKLFHVNGNVGYEGSFFNNSPSGQQCKIFDRHGNQVYQGGFADGVNFKL